MPTLVSTSSEKSHMMMKAGSYLLKQAPQDVLRVCQAVVCILQIRSIHLQERGLKTSFVILTTCLPRLAMFPTSVLSSIILYHGLKCATLYFAGHEKTLPHLNTKWPKILHNCLLQAECHLQALLNHFQPQTGLS